MAIAPHLGSANTRRSRRGQSVNRIPILSDDYPVVDQWLLQNYKGMSLRITSGRSSAPLRLGIEALLIARRCRRGLLRSFAMKFTFTLYWLGRLIGRPVFIDNPYCKIRS